MTAYAYDEIFARNLLLLGREAVDKLRNSHVIVCGLGGVGSYVAEALARSGLGKLTLVDSDRVALSNLNRQLPALIPTVGQPKVQVMAERIQAINPECELILENYFIEEGDLARLGRADYIVDAVDHLPAKVALIRYARALHIPIACAMGAGLRVAPERLRIADISQTQGCALARKLRRALREINIHDGVPVVYSTEEPREPHPADAPVEGGGIKKPLGSSAFVPATAGLMLASVVVRDLCGIER